MGSTKEIAEKVGAELMSRGLEVDVVPCSSGPKPESYDAVIIGSALYTRRWDKVASSYLKQYATVLAERPTWLFQSGPCGPGAETEQLDPPRAVAKQLRKHGLPRPHTFGGRLDVEHAIGPVSRWMAADGPMSGDFRDWELIRGWAQGIAEELTQSKAKEDDVNSRIDEDETIPTFSGISPGRCTELLQTQTIGRVAWQSADGPEILPVTYTWHENSVIFRTAADGPLADLDRPTDVAFEIDEVDQVRRQGWSVVVRGQAQAVAEPERLMQLRTVADVPWAGGRRNLFIQIAPTRVSGREVAARP